MVQIVTKHIQRALFAYFYRCLFKQTINFFLNQQILHIQFMLFRTQSTIIIVILYVRFYARMLIKCKLNRQLFSYP